MSNGCERHPSSTQALASPAQMTPIGCPAVCCSSSTSGQDPLGGNTQCLTSLEKLTVSFSFYYSLPNLGVVVNFSNWTTNWCPTQRQPLIVSKPCFGYLLDAWWTMGTRPPRLVSWVYKLVSWSTQVPVCVDCFTTALNHFFLPGWLF